MTIQSIPYVTLLGILFGSTLIASRFSVGQFQPTTYIGLRLTMAGLGHVVIYTLSRQRHWPAGRRLWQHGITLGVIGTAIPMTSIVISLQYLSSGVASLLITTGPALTVLLAHFFLPDEALNRRKSGGVILALGGAALLALRGESGLPNVSQASPVGYGLVLLAMVTSSCMTIYARRYMRDLDAFDVASIRMFAAALTIMPLSVLLVGLDLHAVDSQGYLALVYAALVGTFAGMMLAFHNIKRFGATAAAMTAYIIPLVAGVGGILVLGETFTVTMLVGMGIIIMGIAIINQSSPAQASPGP
jgi:drug/metabolite transporter (DMT)-like permease